MAPPPLHVQSYVNAPGCSVSAERSAWTPIVSVPARNSSVNARTGRVSPRGRAARCFNHVPRRSFGTYANVCTARVSRVSRVSHVSHVSRVSRVSHLSTAPRSRAMNRLPLSAAMAPRALRAGRGGDRAGRAARADWHLGTRHWGSADRPLPSEVKRYVGLRRRGNLYDFSGHAPPIASRRVHAA